MLHAKIIMVPEKPEPIPYTGSLDLFEHGVNYLPVVVDSANNVVWQAAKPRILKATARIEAEMYIRSVKNGKKVA